MRAPVIFSRTFPALLCVLTLSTQSIFGYRPEKNLWDERRRCTRPTVPSTPPHAPVLPASIQLASLPVPRPALLSYAIHERTQHAPQVPATISRIPASWGRVRRLSPPGRPTGPTIVFIQDIHRNL